MALAIVAGLGAAGTVLAGLVPFLTRTTSDASSGFISSLTSRIGQTIGVSSTRVQSEEEKMIEDTNKKYSDTEIFLRKVVYSENMVKTHIPDALIKEFAGDITTVDDIYKKISEFKQDPRLNTLIFKKYQGYLKYKDQYLRVLSNFYDLFERMKKLKLKLNSIYEDQASKAFAAQRYKETDPDIQKIVGNEFPKFIRSEMSIIYEEFIDIYEDYIQYNNRISNFYKLIVKGGFDKLDIYEVARTDISKLTGRKEGPLLRTTEQVVDAAQPILDKISKYRLNYLMCLQQIANTIVSWQTKFKTNKRPVVSSIAGILISEKKYIDSLITDHTANISDLAAIQAELLDYKKNDKLDDARTKLDILKAKEKKVDDLKEQITLFNARLASYVETVNKSGEDSITYTPCDVNNTTTPMTPSGQYQYTPSNTEETTREPRGEQTSIVLEGLIKNKFKDATDKQSAESHIGTLEDIIKQTIPTKIRQLKNEYIKIDNLEKLTKDKDFFGGEDLYGITRNDKRFLEEIMKSVK